MTTYQQRVPQPPPGQKPECVLVLPVYKRGQAEPSWTASLGYMDYTSGVLTPMGERWSFDTLEQALDATRFLAQRVTGT